MASLRILSNLRDIEDITAYLCLRPNEHITDQTIRDVFNYVNIRTNYGEHALNTNAYIRLKNLSDNYGKFTLGEFEYCSGKTINPLSIAATCVLGADKIIGLSNFPSTHEFVKVEDSMMWLTVLSDRFNFLLTIPKSRVVGPHTDQYRIEVVCKLGVTNNRTLLYKFNTNQFDECAEFTRMFSGVPLTYDEVTKSYSTVVNCEDPVVTAIELAGYYPAKEYFTYDTDYLKSKVGEVFFNKFNERFTEL